MLPLYMKPCSFNSAIFSVNEQLIHSLIEECLLELVKLQFSTISTDAIFRPFCALIWFHPFINRENC